MAVFKRAESYGFSVLFQPVLSTTALLLLLGGLQLLMIGMVTDALLMKIGKSSRPRIASAADEGEKVEDGNVA